jgi:hypothetical protein
VILSADHPLDEIDADGVGATALAALRAAGIATIGEYLRTSSATLRAVPGIGDTKIDALDRALAYFGRPAVLRRRRLGWYQHAPTYVFGERGHREDTTFHYLAVSTVDRPEPRGLCARVIVDPLFSFHAPFKRYPCGKCADVIAAEARRHG